jgi:hypothetical protein
MTIYTSTKVLPYVYMGTHKETKHIYVGSRTSKALKLPPEQDLIKYRTSSKTVKPIFDEFEWRIVAMFFDRQDAYKFEQHLIIKNWANPLSINKCSISIRDGIIGNFNNSKNWLVISPKNEIFKVKGLTNICDKYLLDPANMIRVSQGIYKHHKWWRCIEADLNWNPCDIDKYNKMLSTFKPNWLFINQHGETFKTDSFNHFCITYNLNISSMYAVARGDAHHHKKWRCEQILHSNQSNPQPFNLDQRKISSNIRYVGIKNNISHEFFTIDEFCSYSQTGYRIVKKLLNGVMLAYKGWKLYKTVCNVPENVQLVEKILKHTPYESRYIINSPDGITYDITNLREFCRTHGLNQSGMTAVSNMKYSAYKKWTCVKYTKLLY